MSTSGALGNSDKVEQALRDAGWRVCAPQERDLASDPTAVRTTHPELEGLEVYLLHVDRDLSGLVVAGIDADDPHEMLAEADRLAAPIAAQHQRRTWQERPLPFRYGTNGHAWTFLNALDAEHLDGTPIADAPQGGARSRYVFAPAQPATLALTDNGTAAVILPDNVLFEGGRGATIRRELLKRFNLHTMLRLPAGIFYAGGVKANVLFFDSAPPRRSDDEPPHTQQLWVYDLRTGSRFTLKQNPLLPVHLEDFEKRVFGVGECEETSEAIDRRTPEGRLQVFDGAELAASKDVNLDIGLIEPDDKDAAEAKSLTELTLALSADLRGALLELEHLAADLDVELSPPT